ncbi:MAG TPA: hypothetical protein VE242_13920, partial [Chthoniobacterales bacterium]|nr:hypothetical protein [Chthoniobacterales bacterium]
DGRALSTAFQAKADNTETEESTEAQSATVVDPYGWTNLRANASTESKIKGRVNAGNPGRQVVLQVWS